MVLWASPAGFLLADVLLGFVAVPVDPSSKEPQGQQLYLLSPGPAWALPPGATIAVEVRGQSGQRLSSASWLPALLYVLRLLHSTPPPQFLSCKPSALILSAGRAGEVQAIEEVGKCLGESAWLMKTLYRLFQAIIPPKPPFWAQGRTMLPLISQRSPGRWSCRQPV